MSNIFKLFLLSNHWFQIHEYYIWNYLKDNKLQESTVPVLLQYKYDDKSEK